MGLLDGRVAIVTGAAQGLGFAIAHRLAAEGARVAMVDVQSEKLGAAVKKLDPSGETAMAVTADVTSTAAVQAMMSAILARFHQIDMLVNVAGGSGRQPIGSIDEMTDDAWDSIIAGNLRSTFLCCRAAAPHLRRSADGRILNFSSGAVQGIKSRTTISAPLAYASAKAGIHGLSNQLAKDLEPDGVAVNVLQPGFVLTESGARVRELFEALTEAERTTMLTQLKIPPRQPEEVGYGVAYLMSGATKGVTGTALRLTGKIINTELRIVPEGTSPFGPFARIEPAASRDLPTDTK